MDVTDISARNVTGEEFWINIIFVLTIYIPLDFVIICGNAFVFAVIRQTPSLQKPQFTLLGSLALVDLLTGVIGVPVFVWGFVTRGSLHLLNIDSCQLQYFPMKIFISTSFLHLVFITTDRYVSIVKPLRYEQIVTRSRIYCAIAFSWITACVYVSIQLFWKSKRIEGAFFCFQMNPQGFVVQRYVVLILVPAGVILLIIMYFRIFMEARKHTRVITLHTRLSTQTTVHKKFKAAKTSAMIVCLFAVAYLPYSLRGVIFLFGIQRSEIYWYDLMTEVLLAMSSAVNPFIYVFRHKQFSTALSRILRNNADGY
ncbi:adenosine receptor A2b-like [Anneissia japonica]|uniref:adenosine receptor A2b-like n=1 Tax=Anneissia japonica TaxID=1529436 RepID=UPI00142556DD|nr:adenosine receptor A2b-like [Anneissia japonica]